MIYPVRNDFLRAGKYLFLAPNFPALKTGVKTGYIIPHASIPALKTGVKTGYIIPHASIPALETGVKTGYIIPHLGFSPCTVEKFAKTL